MKVSEVFMAFIFEGFMKVVLSLFFSIFCAVSSMGSSIKGRVTDEQKNPVPYCSIYLKGTTVGTTSNPDGEFSIEVSPGTYEIIFRCIGFKLASRTVTVTSETVSIEVTLAAEAYILKEATINASAEDPAYAIMRKAIKMRKRYEHEVDSFMCRSYVKSTQRLLAHPKKLLGQEINFGDFLDTVSKIYYLSESVADLSVVAPDKVKEVMISSKVSGMSKAFSFNRSADLRVNFYQNLIPLGELSPRGLVSPVAASAMFYYDYRLEGTFQQYGQTINKIKVIPKRKHDPVLTGDIYIVEDSWRIHSLDLFITSNQQIEFIDTFRVTETYIPVGNVWMLLNSEFNFEFRIMGFHGKGVILGIFSNYDVDPKFPEGYFSSEIMSIKPESNKKDSSYWETARPVPLTREEDRDYVKRDSLFAAHNTKEYMDSVDRKNNKFSMLTFLLAGYRYQNSYKKYAVTLSGIIQNVQFNTVEGWVAGLQSNFAKYMEPEGRRNTWMISVDARYGFSNRRFNANAMFQQRYNNKRLGFYYVRAGTEVQDFNNRAYFPPLVNTGYTLLAQKNYLKLYERKFINAYNRVEVVNGFVIRTGLTYADRTPLVNTTDFSWNNIPDRRYLSNDPLNPLTDSLRFNRNQLFAADVLFRFNFRQKYVMRPEGKSIMGSKYPELSVRFAAAIPASGFADMDFSEASVSVVDDVRLGLLGGISWSATYGRFLTHREMEFMDYHHFNGNRTLFSEFSLYDFHLLDYYTSATNREYAEVHGEYNMGGLIFNKFPLLRELKLMEIVGAHFFYARYSSGRPVKNYYETSFGIEKFGLLRADFVLAFEHGRIVRTGFVFGLKIVFRGGRMRIVD